MTIDREFNAQTVIIELVCAGFGASTTWSVCAARVGASIVHLLIHCSAPSAVHCSYNAEPGPPERPAGRGGGQPAAAAVLLAAGRAHASAHPGGRADRQLRLPAHLAVGQLLVAAGGARRRLRHGLPGRLRLHPGRGHLLGEGAALPPADGHHTLLPRECSLLRWIQAATSTCAPPPATHALGARRRRPRGRAEAPPPSRTPPAIATRCTFHTRSRVHALAPPRCLQVYRAQWTKFVAECALFQYPATTTSTTTTPAVRSTRGQQQ